MKYNSLEDYVKNSKSNPCGIANRNYEVIKARESGLTLSQIAIKFNLSRRTVAYILENK